jgi:hypothetical protein
MFAMDSPTLSGHLIDRLNSLLGAPGQPSFSGTPAAPRPTGGLIWTELPGTAASISSAVRAEVAGETAVAYKRIYVWLGPHAAEALGVVVLPLADQFEILRIEMGQPGYPAAEPVITELQAYDRDFGLSLDGADYATVEFTLRRLPSGAEAVALNARLMAFSPDIVYAVGEVAFDVAAHGGRVVLWWD